MESVMGFSVQTKQSTGFFLVILDFSRNSISPLILSNSLRQTRHRAWVEELVDQGTNWLIDGLIDGLID